MTTVKIRAHNIDELKDAIDALAATTIHHVVAYKGGPDFLVIYTP